MKKTVAFLLTLMIVLSSISFSVSATEGAKKDVKAIEKNSSLVSLNTEYVEVGKEIVATVHESGEFTYQWYVDNTLIVNSGNTFVPTEYDVEKMVTVRVFDAEGVYTGSGSVYISKLPVVYIETENRKNVVDKNEVAGHITFQGNSTFKDTSKLYDGGMTIKCRGNTTMYDAKKPFKLKLDSKADLFGMGKNKHWVLLSNPYDVSLIRNMVAFNFAKDIGIDYQQFQSVDVIMNGKYAGNYLLCEHVRIDNTRVDITNWDNEAENAAKAIYSANKNTMTKDERDVLIDNMTNNMDWVTDDTVEFNGVTYTVSDYYQIPSYDGGYLLCIDKAQRFTSTNGVSIGIEKPEGIGEGMYKAITSYYQDFEDALFSDDFCKEIDGEKVRYTDLIDVDSFVKGFLINELACNVDFGFKSTYMYKDSGGLLKFGPAWDFDLSFGTLNINPKYDASYINAWKTLKRKLLARLCSDPYFLSLVRDTYWEYRYTAIEDIIKEGGTIDTYAQLVKESAVADQQIWSYNRTNAMDVESLKRWACMRVEWLDSIFQTLPDVYNSMSSFFTEKYDVSEYVKPDDYVKKLEIISMPQKTTYNAGEKVDVTGLVLRATFSDGTTKLVEPSGVVTYAKDYVGAPKYYSDVVTDENAKDIFVSLKYKNASVDYKINVSDKQDYKAVETLIEKCPTVDGFNQKYIQNIIEAKIAFDCLSDEAKELVANKDRLDMAMSCIDKMAEASDSGVIGCYMPHISLPNNLKDMVFLVKGLPSSIRWLLSDGVNTITYRSGSDAVRSIKTLGDYSVWTIKANIRDFSAKSIYSNQSKPVGDFEFKSAQYLQIQNDFTDMTYTSFVNLGENAQISLTASKLIEKIIVEENGTVIATCDNYENGMFNVSVPFESTGVHNVSIKYISCGNELYYRDAAILVREKITDYSFVPDNYLYGAITNVTYKESAQNKKTFTVTVQGRAFKIQFIDDAGNTVTKIRDDSSVSIKSFNANGVECSSLERTAAYEKWTFTVTLKAGTYTAISRDSVKGWESVEYGYVFSVINSVVYSDVYSITPASNTVKVGTPLNLKVVTGKDILKIQILVDNATDGAVTFSAGTYGTIDGGTCVYNVYVKLYSAGVHTLKVKIKKASGWEIYEEDVTAVVTAIK